jgi:hypothetical protein
VALAVALCIAHRVAAGTPFARHRRAAGRPVGAAGLALAGPAVLIGRALLRRDLRWQPPSSPAGRLLLVGYLGAGAVAEELAWRAPLTYLPPGRLRAVASLVSGAGFVAAHLPRDGRASIPMHGLNTAGWTAAALAGHRARWSALSHTGYNLAAVTLRPATDEASPA